MIFWVENFRHFEKKCSGKNSTFKIKKIAKKNQKQQKLPQLPTV